MESTVKFKLDAGGWSTNVNVPEGYKILGYGPQEAYFHVTFHKETDTEYLYIDQYFFNGSLAVEGTRSSNKFQTGTGQGMRTQPNPKTEN